MPSLRVLCNKWSRKLHRWGAIATLLPLGLVIATGILLQLKKQSSWVQPATMRSPDPALLITFDEILNATIAVPEAKVRSWDDIDRLDVRPDRGVVKVRTNSSWEVQLDGGTGEVLQIAYRRSDLIESLHDGTFFGDWAKLWLFLPNGLILFALWLTGIYLWVLPIWAKRRRKHAAPSRRSVDP